MEQKRKEGKTRKDRKSRNRKTGFKKLVSLLVYAGIAAAAAVLLSILFLPVLQVSGPGMEPTLQNEDVLLLVRKSEFQPGDVVGIRQDGKILLKRIIAMEQDLVSMDEEGNVFVNGELLDEPYLSRKALGECGIEFPYLVESGTCFVLGDNREVSVDSRNPILGNVDCENIIGKVLLVLWPFDHAALVN